MRSLCFIVFIYFFSPGFLIAKPEFSKCPGLSEDTVSLIQDNIDSGKMLRVVKDEERDIERKALNIYAQFERECNDADLKKKAKMYIDKAIKKGWKAEVKRMSNAIRSISKFRVPKKEWDLYVKFCEKLNIDPSLYISKLEKEEYFQMGKINQEKNQKKCTSIDNRNDLFKRNMRMQAGDGWCFAFTAADLLSYKYGKLVSAFDIANTWYETSGWDIWQKNFLGRKESGMTFGYGDVAMYFALKRGFCLEETIKSSKGKFDKMSAIINELKKLEEYKSNFDDFHNKSNGDWQSFALCSPLENESWREIFPEMKNEQIYKVLFKASLDSILDDMVKEGCQNKRIKMNDVSVKMTNFNPFAWSYLETIDEQLNKKNIVGISYSSSILFGPYDETSGSHASSIVGRRFNEKTNSCEYLVRNSYGEDCERYYSEYECEKGNVWVPKYQIDKGTKNIFYLE